MKLYVGNLPYNISDDQLRDVFARFGTPESARVITDRLRQRMGGVRIVIEQVAEIPRTANGKVRAVICQLSPEERAAALKTA